LLGKWSPPLVNDIELKSIVDLLIKINARQYSIEAANVRHEHEYRVWEDVKLPEGRMLMPGVISHATDLVEHPELVAERIVRYANSVGRENVQTGTDCGMGSRVGHEEVVWAKLSSMVEGARLATERLWG
jgi:5-methyltetrahydropteroyltriglutamate--homocysteine methyltransferase